MAGTGVTSGPDLSGLRIGERERGSPGGRRPWRWIALAVAAVLVLVAAVVALRGRVPEVEVAAARPGNDPSAATLLNASGYVTPRRRATVAAKITARVLDVFVDEGMVVAEGQVLAKLDDADALRRLAAARTAARRAPPRVSPARSEPGQRGAGMAVRQKELDKRRVHQRPGRRPGAHDRRQPEGPDRGDPRGAGPGGRRPDRRRRQQDLDNCTVRAPFAGVVVSKDAQRGEMVSPISAGGGFTRTGIATIVDMDSIEIEVDVNESYIARVKPGQRVEAVLDAYPDWRIPAKVRTVIPTADRQKATVKVRISFDKLDPADPARHGRQGRLPGRRTGRPERPAAQAVIPREAVRTLDGQSVVFVVRDGRVERRAVSLGTATGGEVEVTAGLAPGDQVVIRGPADLRDGQRIKVK